MISGVEAADARSAIDAVWRIESPKLIAALTRVTRDIDVAEDLAQDALLAALEQWPRDGIPRNPGAWLMAAAKNRAIDHFRRNARVDRKHEQLGYEIDAAQEGAAAQIEAALDDDIGDDLLRLIFTACHPALSIEAQVALTLRLLGGLTTDEIARAFLVPESTVAQRIVRAKRSLADKKVPYEVPRGDDRVERLASVLNVIYLVFNEGYAATAGDDWMRPALCEEAMRLGRVLVGLAPQEPEAWGLVALMELTASRAKARVDAEGTPVLLMDQNRAKWDRLLIRRGLSALARAEELGGSGGPYALQAAIAACHARAVRSDDTDWARIAAIYGQLMRLAPSPVVELNRGVAVGMAFGPEAGLEIVDGLVDAPALKSYPFLPAARADLLEKLGRMDEAQQEFERAASLTRNAREQKVLRDRARAAGFRRG